ncbi:hypothetical protein INT47_007467 [Mucor saturninus]|uniref:Uncharacterized protein n=1 Tax=Mucor saturninus TaxID=64648 RepID=A0A8H7QEI0_9FUNG|nr:hypothetical protein INT47_007467 [Mucor saturninus]
MWTSLIFRDSLDDIQLWAPFGGRVSLDGDYVEGIACSRVKDDLSRYYRRCSGNNAATSFVCTEEEMRLVGKPLRDFHDQLQEHTGSDNNTRFLVLVEIMKHHYLARHNKFVPLVKASSDIAQPSYSVINLMDIEHQVGLIKFPPNRNQFYVIAPYFVFNDNLQLNKGNLSIL